MRIVGHLAASLVLLFLVAIPVFLFWPRLRVRFIGARARGLAVIWSAVAICDLLSSPACLYLPYVPGPTTSSRILLGIDRGDLYWLEGKRSAYALAIGPRLWWQFSPHAMSLYGGLEFVPPLRLRPSDDRELSWEVVTTSGRRTPYPADSDGYLLGRFQVVVEGGAVVADAVEGLKVLYPGRSDWVRLQPSRLDHRYAIALARSARGFVEVLEKTSLPPDNQKQRDLLVRERELSGAIVRERHCWLPSRSSGYWETSRELLVSLQNDTVYLLDAGWTLERKGLAKVFALQKSDEPKELCTLAYRPHQPLSFAVSSDERAFTNGQAIFEMDGTMLMAMNPTLRYVMWQGISVAGVRAYPFVGDSILTKSVVITHYLREARGVDPDSEGRSDFGFGIHESPMQSLSRATHEQPRRHGGIDDAAGSDEIVWITVK